MYTDLQQDVIKRLSQIGWKITESDEDLIASAVKKTMIYFSKYCHKSILNSRLIPFAVDHACGEFLSSKLIAGKIDEETLNISSLKMGDISLSMSSEKENLTDVIERLRCPKEVLRCFRKVIW